jgi:Peroxiredoxin
MPEDYNYDTFRRHMMKEHMHFTGGPSPGELAPDFNLPLAGGGEFRLSEYRGVKPVLIEFGSITCPMTAGARPGLNNLFRDFGNQVQFVSVYVREAHPGERYPHHTTWDQKMRHASDWAQQDRVPWPVAIDGLNGPVHNAYSPLPNSAYLIDRSGRVAFRALWAGQEGLLRDKIEELLDRERNGEGPVILGQQENLIIPLIHGAAEFDYAVARGGEKSKEDFRRELGNVMYAMEKLASKLEPVINPGNKNIH